MMAAIAEIMLGVFVNTFFDPEKVKKMPPWLRGMWVDFNSLFFDPKKHLYLIKKQTRLFCDFVFFPHLLL